MGCNLNDLALCPNRCDCGNMITQMVKDHHDNLKIESAKKKNKLKTNDYIFSKNYFQIKNENNNQKIPLSNQVVYFKDANSKDNNKIIKKVKNDNNSNINIEQNIINGINNHENNTKLNANYLNNCMNNVTIEPNENSDDNSSIYEDNKEYSKIIEPIKKEEKEVIIERESFKNNDIIAKNDKFTIENIKDKDQDKENLVEDLVNLMNMSERDNENDNNNLIDYNGEKCIFKGKLEDKENINGKGIINLKDGRKYEGTFLNGKLEGNGIYTSSEGVIYEGNFINGILVGKGKITKFLENDIKSNGNCDKKDDNKDINKYKIIYEGDIKDFKKEGKGIEICSEYEYKGDFHDDMKHGKGSIIYFNTKQKYKGDFKENNLTGYGIFEWENKQTYEGDVVNGKMEGKGIYKWTDGSEYNGEYKNNIREGKGAFKWANGVIYQGFFANGKPLGKGMIVKGDKSINAEYKNGKFIGDLKESFRQLNIYNFHESK